MAGGGRRHDFMVQYVFEYMGHNTIHDLINDTRTQSSPSSILSKNNDLFFCQLTSEIKWHDWHKPYFDIHVFLYIHVFPTRNYQTDT